MLHFECYISCTVLKFMGNLVTVASFEKSYQAHLAKAQLESNDIQAFVIGDQAMEANHLFAFYPGVSIRVQVRQEDLKAAREILGDHEQADTPASFESCPKCESKEIRRYFSDHKTALALAYIFAPLLILAGLWGRKRRCLSCNHRWML